jgi:hypothetical protein
VAAPAPASIEAPEGMLASGRIENVRVSWDNVQRLLHRTSVGGIGADLETMVQVLVGADMAGLVDLDRPADVALFDGADERIALSMHLRPGAAARLRKSFALKERGGGGLLYVTGDREVGPVDPATQACAFDVEDEDDPLVACAADEDLLEQAAPYFLRVLARVKSEDDISAQLDFAKLRPLLDDDDDDAPPKNRAEAEGSALGEGLIADLGLVGLAGSWGRNELTAEFSLGFAERRSPLTLAMTGRPRPDAPPPSSFLRLPRDAGLAFYAQGLTAADLDPLRDVAVRALRADMLDEGYDAAKLEDFLGRLASLFLAGSPFALAAGVDRAGAEHALAAWDHDRKTPKTREAAFRSLRGWMVAGIEGDAWSRGLADIVRLSNELDQLKNGGKKPAGGAAVKGSSTDDDEQTEGVIAAAPKDLPKGALHVEMRARPLAKDVRPAHTSHLYVVPDGARTWIGLGEDEAAMIARLKAAISGEPARTVAGMPELSDALVQGAMAGGYFTLAGAELLFTDDQRDAHLPAALSTLNQLGALPMRGDTVLPFVVLSEEMPPRGARLRARVRLPVQAIGDIIARAKL